MKTTLIRNYWLIILAWSMILDGHNRLAMALALVGCALLCLVRKQTINWRVLAISLMINALLTFFLSCSNILLFFPKLSIFLAIVSFNSAISNEYLYYLKSKYLKTISLIMFIALFISLTITFILPEELYSLFSKANLYLMNCLIFLPYLIPCVICVSFRKLRALIEIKKVLHFKSKNSRIVLNSR